MKRFLLPMLAMLLLTACGNADKGLELKNKNGGISTARSITITDINPNLTLGPCQNLTVFGGNDPSFAATYSGTSACPSSNVSNIVRLRVNANFPSSTRFCIVPYNATNSFAHTCFNVNGQADVTLTTAAFTGIVLVREADLQSYLSYLNNPAAGGYPPLAMGIVR